MRGRLAEDISFLAATAISVAVLLVARLSRPNPQYQGQAATRGLPRPVFADSPGETTETGAPSAHRVLTCRRLAGLGMRTPARARTSHIVQPRKPRF